MMNRKGGDETRARKTALHAVRAETFNDSHFPGPSALIHKKKGVVRYCPSDGYQVVTEWHGGLCFDFSDIAHV